MAKTLSKGLRAWWLFRKAQGYHQRGAYRKAAALYQQVLALDPEDRGAWLWRGLALAERGLYREALEHVERAGALGRLFQARILLDMGRAEEARPILMECSGNTQDAQALLALCQLRRDETEDAWNTLSGSMRQAPWLLSRLLVAIEEGIPLATSPPARGPEPDPAPAPRPQSRRRGARQLRRGLIHLRAERFEQALAAFRSAYGSLPDEPKAAYGLGVSLYYLGHLEEAERKLLEAENRLPEPYSSDAKAALGRIAVELGDPQKAVGLLRRAVAAGAVAPENYYALGLSFLRSRRGALARRAFERCASPQFVRERLREMIDLADGLPGV